MNEQMWGFLEIRSQPPCSSPSSAAPELSYSLPKLVVCFPPDIYCNLPLLSLLFGSFPSVSSPLIRSWLPSFIFLIIIYGTLELLVNIAILNKLVSKTPFFAGRWIDMHSVLLFLMRVQLFKKSRFPLAKEIVQMLFLFGGVAGSYGIFGRGYWL